MKEMAKMHKPHPATADEPTFEEALGQLEGIVRRLEDGELGLGDSLTQYEQGVGLLRVCFKLLEGAERRIEILAGLTAEGEPETEPFDDAATLELHEKDQLRSRRRPKNPSRRAKSVKTDLDPLDDSEGEEMDDTGRLF